jgi:hypothetical protein
MKKKFLHGHHNGQDMDEYSDPSPIATAEQFKKALLAIRDRVGISQKDLAMLRTHCRAPAHTITSHQLAQEFGYSHFLVANGQYGTFAHLVADALHYTPGPFPDGNPHWWRTLAYGNDGVPQTKGGNYEWVMRPELVQALQDMKWA